MKVFFMSTHPNQGTGYGRVANKITNHLASLPGVEIVYYAFQNWKGQDVKDRFIDPRIKFYDAVELDPESQGGFGDAGIIPSIIKEKPDVLFHYGDIQIIVDIMCLIPPEHMPPKKYLYLDIVYPWQNVDTFELLKECKFDHIWTFLDTWTRHMVDDLKFDPSNVITMVHGVDFERFIDIPREEAKVKVGLKPDDYLVVNMNRNSARKMWETTIKAFLEFLQREQMNPRIKLFCGGLPFYRNGVNIGLTVRSECLRRGMDVERVMNHHVLINPKPLHLTDAEVNDIYNAGDVGLSTTRGEGFGLTPVEHMYLNRPQVVTGIPALKETMGPYAHFVEPKVWVRIGEAEPNDGEVALCDYKDFADHLQYCFKNPDERPNARDYLKENYSWDHMYKELDREFNNGEVRH
jgi:glycosyltransferase involved in cell wall biosynthesis|tara:strand:+ start:143 stop:1360 length:1218 start_codon:yes stop_codon:yes gene_type:complete